VIEPRSRSVLDIPPSRGMTVVVRVSTSLAIDGKTAGLRPAGWPRRNPAFSPSCHFPFAPKRIMVPVRFALGEI
jgi:hypothetical protein